MIDLFGVGGMSMFIRVAGRRRVRGRIRRLVACAAVILAVAAANGVRAQEKKQIVWGAPNVLSSYYWDVLGAIDLGYMAEEGLTIKVVNNDNPVQNLQYLATGAIDISSITVELALSAIEKGADFKFLASENDRLSFVLMARPDIKSYGDLRGKTLGVTQLQESTASLIRLLLEKHGVKRNEYEFMALGGTPNRFAALVRGAVSATMLSPPFDFKAEAEGMKRFGTAFEAFEGAGVVFTAQTKWAENNADEVVRFLRAAARAQRLFYDPSNKAKAVEILVKQTRLPAADIDKNYDAVYGPNQIMSRDLELTDKLLQPWLDLRGSSEKPSRYIDLTYWKHALGR
jgi:ABC-type nitrate/sulfonate/bicarbonate transport system substrate-binding protein